MLILSILGFLVCIVVITVSGARLSRYGDQVAELSGMGKAWFGLVLMAAVTSLPELFTGISSVVLVDAPDIAAGNIIGSCAFNLLIIALLDIFLRKKNMYSLVNKSHILAALTGMFLLTLFLLAVVFPNRIPSLQWISLSSFIIIGAYLFGVALLFQNQQPQSPEVQDTVLPSLPQKGALRKALSRYIFYAAFVIAGAIALPYFADRIAADTGINHSFVGTLLVGAATSLPELVVSYSAIRIGSYDIAFGNLLGSNIFNILILALEDVLYTKQPLYAAIDSSHTLTGLVSILMTLIISISIFISREKKRFSFHLPSWLLIAMYITLMVVLYKL